MYSIIIRVPVHPNKFQKGVDERGYCKHIRDNMEERCGWTQIVDGGAPTENKKCPKCKASVTGNWYAV